MEQPAWSGWWWPATTAVRPPHLFDPDGPLHKYDSYADWRTGDDPGTLVWERERYLLAGGPTWAGHCNGFAAAAVYEPEPTKDVQAGPISFTVADLKGLLADYHFADAAAWLYGGEDGDLDPTDFNRQLTEWMIGSQKGFVMVFHPGGQEIWSYPAYRARVVYAPDPRREGVTHVKATVWMADMMVPAESVGTKNYPSDDGKLFEYVLYGNRDNPDGAAWEGQSLGGAFSRPWQIWYPEPQYRNLQRELASPGLDYRLLREILGRPLTEEPTEQPAPPGQPAPSLEAPPGSPPPGTPPAGEPPAGTPGGVPTPAVPPATPVAAPAG
jgi:hypothetical protein